MSAVAAYVIGHMPAHLREYWIHGKGALKVRWGTRGDFLRCVRLLRKYFPRNPKGLCNVLHREALGVAPGQEHAALVAAMPHAVYCQDPLHKGPCKGHKQGQARAVGGTGTDNVRGPGGEVIRPSGPDARRLAEARRVLADAERRGDQGAVGKARAAVDATQRAAKLRAWMRWQQEHSISDGGGPVMTEADELAMDASVDDMPDDDGGDEFDEEFAAALPRKMGWRNLVVPYGKPTGDGREFAPDSVTNRDLPLPAAYQRDRSRGHDGAITVARVLGLDYQPDGVYAWGDWIDEIPETAEAKLLMEKRVLGSSPDIDDAVMEMRNRDTGQPYNEGTDCGPTGCAPQLMYTTRGRIAGLVFVQLPAFAEANHVEPYEMVDEDGIMAAFVAEGADPDTGCGCDEPVAAVVAATVVEHPGPEVFAAPVMDTPRGFVAAGERIYGYFAQAGTCHTNYRHTCMTPPVETDYALFHRYPTPVGDGYTMAGRITVGYGQHMGLCGCCRLDDHACVYYGLDDTIAHYDGLDTVAHVRAGADDAGNLWYSGMWAPGATAAGQAIVAARGVSGDWREVDGQLHLVEIMGCSVSTPAFPVGRQAHGRQRSLVAASGFPVTDPAGDAAAVLGEFIRRTIAEGLAAPGRAHRHAELAGEFAALRDTAEEQRIASLARRHQELAAALVGS